MTLILDTSVVSESMRPAPAPRVALWLDGPSLDGLVITAVAVARLLCGQARLPHGRRKSDLHARLDTVLRLGFLNRVVDRACRADRWEYEPINARLPVQPKDGPGGGVTRHNQ